MYLVLKTRYKNIEIDLSGSSEEDTVQKLADTIAMLKSKHEEILSQVMDIDPLNAHDVYRDMISDFHNRYFKMVNLEKDGPRIHPDILKSISESNSTKGAQADAFIVISYLLKIKYGEDNLSVKRVTKLMKESGLDCSNLQNLTPYLSKRMQYILKPAGSQYFAITLNGENRAKYLLERSQY
jgi:predicted transcriptional regulator